MMTTNMIFIPKLFMTDPKTFDPMASFSRQDKINQSILRTISQLSLIKNIVTDLNITTYSG